MFIFEAEIHCIIDYGTQNLYKSKHEENTRIFYFGIHCQ